MKTTATSSSPSSPALPCPSLNRRRFLQTAALAGAAPMILPSGLLAAAPNSRLNHACIGTGGMGAGDLDNFKSHPKVQVVALCDVDQNTLKAAKTKVPDVRAYADWRELLAQDGDKVDSVNVTVPDHMHFPIAYSAIQRGKHVYCQKPMCHDVAEVRRLTEASVTKGVVTQLGTQMASGYGDRATVQLLQAGVIGKVKHVYLSANRPGAVESYRLLGPRPTTPQQPPPHLNWDLWLGTAPARPFVPGIYHPVKWRAWLDFGTGWSGDIGCHIFDAVWKGLRLKAPLTVQARAQDSWVKSPERRADAWPQANHVTWVFPGNELTTDKLTVEWFDGEFWVPEEIRALYSVKDWPTESAMFIGSEGALLLPLGRGPILLPEEKFKDVVKPKIAARNHYHHFVNGCLGTEKNESHFAQTGPMTEAILLGTVALRVSGKELAWNAERMLIPNNPEATALLQRTYREGWRV